MNLYLVSGKSRCRHSAIERESRSFNLLTWQCFLKLVRMDESVAVAVIRV